MTSHHGATDYYPSVVSTDGASRVDVVLRPEPRPIASAARSTNLDIVRAVAALLVLTGHSYLLSGHYLNPTELRPDHLLITNMAAGVWLFFALSGFLIAAPYVDALVAGRPLPGLRSYALRRAARIYPLYIVAFLVAGLVAPVSPVTHWWQWPLHLALLHNLVPGEEQAILFASWTLTIEVLYYAAVPIAARAVRRMREGPIPGRTIVAGVIAVWVASTLFTGTAGLVQPHHIKIGLWLRFVFPATVAMFCPGLIVAVAAAEDRHGSGPWRWWSSMRARPRPWLAAAIVLALVACVLETRTNSVVYDLQRVPFALASGIAVAVAAARPERRTVPARVLARVGLVSYGIYLWQAVILQIIMGRNLYHLVPWPHTGPLPFAAHVAYMLALVVPTAWISWTFFERPILHRVRRMVGRSEPGGPGPA